MTHYLSERTLKNLDKIINKCNDDKGTARVFKVIDVCVGKLFPEAKAGDVEAMKFLGKHWHNHRPTEEEKEYMGLDDYGWTWNGACFWYEKAAETGDIDAMANAGNILFFVQGERAKAIKYLKKAAELGDSWALNFMAGLY